MRLHPNAGLLILITGCTSSPSGGFWHTRDDPSSREGDTPAASASEAPAGGSSAKSATIPGGSSPPPAARPPPPPGQVPAVGRRLSEAGDIWRMTRSFNATTPVTNANDYHASDVTGSDCMQCHGSAGTAPRFAFAGTIAMGEQWTWAPPGWQSSQPPREWYDDYGYDDYGYDDYGYSDDYSYDDYGYGYGSPKKGWPVYRTKASPGTEVRIVGNDGLVFETVTDRDGNFWFKSSSEVVAPAFTGLRKDAFTISGRSNGMACASCHESGAADNPGRLWTWNGSIPR